MLLELGRVLALLASILSLYRAMFSAFFVPGIAWEERLFLALHPVLIAAVVCLVSGAIFALPRRQSVLSSLPVKLFCASFAGMMALFLVSWYLDVYYIPLTCRHLPC